MTIIVFLIDTSASMYQRTYVGGRTTLLDVAKSAVETFVKIRQRSPDSRVDRYMLLTFEEPPNNIKAGWKENLTTFMNELKNLQCNGMTTMGVAVKQAFDILNLNRMTTGIDTYGQGRCPFFLETAVIVLITDGGKLSTINGVHDEFALPMNSPIPGSEMTREPFRWDQRLFALVLRLAGTPAAERDTGLVPSDCSPVDAMCEVTGGRSYSVISHRMLNQCIDSLVQKVQNGVVINFEKFGPDPPLSEKGDEAFMLLNKDESNNNNTNGNGNIEMYNNEPTNLLMDRGGVVQGGIGAVGNSSWYSCRKMIYVPRAAQKAFPAVGFWPIPEPFWPEVTASALPARSAHPIVKFSCTSSDPMAIENLPFDKYELEPSPLTQFILARKQPTVCWQVFVANSSKNSDVGHPFGYLKASTNLTCVNLFVMPYHYPVLLPLLDELTKVHRWKPTAEWRTQFQNYLRTLPAYYAAPLRKALMKMGTPQVLANSLIPENAENSLSFTFMTYLKRMKTVAKAEYDKMCNDIIQRQLLIKNPFNIPEQVRVIPRVSLKRELISNPVLAEKFNYLRDQTVEHNPPYISIVERERQTVGYRNPFDIPRNRLMAQVAKMRNNFLQSDLSFVDEDITHSLPIAQMGNYQEYLKRQTPQLREIESTPVRQHMFGNPFKIDKRMMVDEADIDLVGASSPGNSPRTTKRINPSPIMDRIPSKRKPGPLPRDLVVRRPSSCSETSSIASMSPPGSPIQSPVPSPVPWLNFSPSSPSQSQPPPIDIKPVIESFSPLSFSDLSLSAPQQLQSCSYPLTPSTSPCPSPNPYQNIIPSPIITPTIITTSTNSLLLNGTVDDTLQSFSNSNFSQLQRSRSPSPPLLQGGSTLFAPIAHTQQTLETSVLLYNPTTINAIHTNTNVGLSPRATYSTSNSSTNLPYDGGTVGTVGVCSGGGNGITTGYSQSNDQKFKYNDMLDDKLNIREILKEANMGMGIGAVGMDGGDRVNGGVSSGKLGASGESLTTGKDKDGGKTADRVVQIKVENLQEIESQNQELRRTLNKLVRRPGKNFTDLFENIKLLKGDFKMQVSILRLIINESLRFKRKQLALQLEDYIKSISTTENAK